MPESVTLGDTSVHPFESLDAIVSTILPAGRRVTPGFGVAINPEKIVRAREDANLRATLDMATIRFADGIGVVWALRRRGVKAVRLAGVDLWYRLMKEAARSGRNVFLLGGEPGVVEEVSSRLRADMPGIRIVGARHGFIDADAEREIARTLAATSPEVVSVAMGSPRQEKVIARLRAAYPDAFYLGVGGTFDVYAGKVKRAPVWMQRIGLEWLYRLLRQPSRAGRQRNLVRFVRLEMSGQL
jgi:UDP-N-acetyl-D-mannosaminouronate:lipid I N-acetyl-D-mannosaminouronosyltransferase